MIALSDFSSLSSILLCTPSVGSKKNEVIQKCVQIQEVYVQFTFSHLNYSFETSLNLHSPLYQTNVGLIVLGRSAGVQRVLGGGGEGGGRGHRLRLHRGYVGL